MMAEVCEWLVNWFVSRGRIKAEQGPDYLEKNYFEAGLLNSLEVIELVSEIEEQHKIRFSERDFQDRRFGSIAGLGEMIWELRSQQRGNNGAAGL